MVKKMTAKPSGKKLTSRETARILGVSEASVKRWADGGLLPTIRTAGGHRRFLPEDVAVFQRSGFGHKTISAGGRAGAAQASSEAGPVAADASLMVEEMFEALVEGGIEEIAALLINLSLHEWSVGRIADVVLCPALRRIGDLWHQGKLSVAEEHVASRAGLAAMQRLRGVMSASATRPALAISCSAENDFHEFPVQIVNLLLENMGWDVVNLGASTPFYALAEAVERFRPRMVCVASTVLGDLDRAVREYREFRQTAERMNVSIVLGGAGFSGRVRDRFEADLHAESFEQLESFAARLTN